MQYLQVSGSYPLLSVLSKSADYLPESDIGKLQIRVTDLENQLTEAQLALTEQYEANLALEDEVTNTQLALTELYEATQTTTTTKEA